MKIFFRKFNTYFAKKIKPKVRLCFFPFFFCQNRKISPLKNTYFQNFQKSAPKGRTRVSKVGKIRHVGTSGHTDNVP